MTIPGTKISGYTDGGALQAGDKFVIARGGNNFKIDASEVGGGGGGLTVSIASVTTSNVSGVADTHHILDVSGMTANRDFSLPTPSAAGERCKVTLSVGDDAYALIVKRNAVEVTRLFIGGETLEFVSTGTGAADWIVAQDGRIPCSAILERRTTQSFESGTYPIIVQLDVEVKDVGWIANPSTYQITARRANEYQIIGVMIFASVFNDQKNIQSIIHINNALDTFQITYTSTATTNQPGMARVTYSKVLAIGDYIELVGFHNFGSAVNSGTTTGFPQLSLRESLAPIV